MLLICWTISPHQLRRFPVPGNLEFFEHTEMPPSLEKKLKSESKRRLCVVQHNPPINAKLTKHLEKLRQ